MTVFANGLEISAKAQGCKVIAAFPDVCFTQPQTPATPPGVPIPYPDFGKDSDLTSGSKTVEIGGKEISQENSSKYSKCTGDEAGCAPKKGMITSSNRGPIYAQKWSMNVKVESKGVVRFTDIATSNHSSDPPETAPMLVAGEPDGEASGGQAQERPACPCCGADPPHDHQVDEDGNLLPTIPEADYYRHGHAARQQPHLNEIQELQGRIANANNNLARATRNGPNPRAEAAIGTQIDRLQARIEAAQTQLDGLDAQLEQLENARDQDPMCPNLHDPADEDCGVHFDRTGQPPIDRDALGFDAAFRYDFRQRWDAAHGTDFSTRVDEGGNNRINHRTPLDAGGCPTSDGNLIPHPALSDECQEIDDIQGTFQGH